MGGSHPIGDEEGCALFHVLFRPIVDRLGDLGVTFFSIIAHVAVAVDALGVERRPILALVPALVAIFHGAMVVEPVMRGLRRRSPRSGCPPEVRQLPAPKRLLHRADESGSVRRPCPRAPSWIVVALLAGGS